MVDPRLSRIQYSLASLSGIVGLIGVGLTALKHPNPWWVVGLVYLTCLMLLLAILFAVYARRAFAGGFALGGFAWFVFLFVFNQAGMRSPDKWPTGVITNSEGYPIGETKGPYAIEENPLHPEQICHWLAFKFGHPYDGAYRCFRVEAHCIATWLIGSFTGVLALLIRTTDAKSTG